MGFMRDEYRSGAKAGKATGDFVNQGCCGGYCGLLFATFLIPIAGFIMMVVADVSGIWVYVGFVVLAIVFLGMLFTTINLWDRKSRDPSE